MTTVNDFTDILRIIRDQPEWGDALRSALLGRDVLEMPQGLAEVKSEVADLKAGQARLEGDVTELKAGQARLEGDVAELKTGQARLEAGQAALEGDVAEVKAGQARLEGAVSHLEGEVGNIKGSNYEIQLGRKIDIILGQRLGLRNVRFLKGSLMGNSAAYQDLMGTAQDRGDIAGQEHEEVNEADFILTGRNPADQSTVYIVVEASVTAGDSDIHRAADRAEILRRVTGETIIAAVVCDNFDGDRQRLAQQRNVTLVTIRT